MPWENIHQVYADSKTQISLCFHAVWSGPPLSANRIIGYYRMFEWRAKPRRYFAHLQVGLNLLILCVFHLTQSSLLSELLYIFINVCVVTATCLADDCLDCSSPTRCRRCAYFLAEGSRECLVKCTGEAKFVYSGEIQGSICVGKFLSTYLVFPF